MGKRARKDSQFMTAIPAFLSYSNKNKGLAGFIKINLDGYGFDTFLAHEDLQPSEEWQKTILLKLKECVVFFPLLTSSFTESDWTDQETGIAVALGKIIVPMKTSVDPYGFISKYQAQSFAGAASGGKLFPPIIDEACWNIVKKLASRRKLGAGIRESVISSFGGSRSFSESAAYADKLRLLEPLTEEQLDEIVRGSCQNNQIYFGFEARAYVNDLIVRESPRIEKTLARQFGELQK